MLRVARSGHDSCRHGVDQPRDRDPRAGGLWGAARGHRPGNEPIAGSYVTLCTRYLDLHRITSPGCPVVLNVTHRAASATRRHSLCSGGRADRLACMPNGAQPSHGRGQPLLMPAPWRSALRKTPPSGMDRWRRSPWREGGRIGARLAGVIAPTPNQPSAAGNLTHQACHAPPSRASRHSAGGQTVTQTRPQPPYGTLFLLLELQDGADLEIDRWL